MYIVNASKNEVNKSITDDTTNK